MSFWKRVSTALGTWRVVRALGLYPPFLGAGVRVSRVARDLKELDVELRLTFWNRNYMGTHFGGSLYSMCDPFFMLMVIANLGPGYVVWDKSATVEFVRPGRGTVRARFTVTDEQLTLIREQVDREGKAYPSFEVCVLDEAEGVVARIGKVLSVRKARSGPKPG